jgi:CRISPR system Cascade subunit CasE
MSAFLSRAKLRRDAEIAAIAPLLVPEGEDARIGAAHRLVWSLFADRPERQRDFLWHEESPGDFLLLSRRPPRDAGNLFEIETKPFAPMLRPGERLDMRLRANPVVTTAKPDEKGRRRHDVVMHALKKTRSGARAEQRAHELGWMEDEAGRSLPPDAPRAWLERQGQRAGFAVLDLTVLAYAQVRLPRRGGDVRFSAVDLEGRIGVERPEDFLAAVVNGFGKAKAFGCGLMLLRRAGEPEA